MSNLNDALQPNPFGEFDIHFPMCTGDCFFEMHCCDQTPKEVAQRESSAPQQVVPLSVSRIVPNISVEEVCALSFLIFFP